jgi:hypothetical protein
MKSLYTKYTEHNFKKGDKVYELDICSSLSKPTIKIGVQEYTIHSIGKKRMYLTIGDDIMSKYSYLSCFRYAFAKTQEEAIELCSSFMIDCIGNIADTMLNTRYINVEKDCAEVLENCKTAKLEIVINPKSK